MTAPRPSPARPRDLRGSRSARRGDECPAADTHRGVAADWVSEERSGLFEGPGHAAGDRPRGAPACLTSPGSTGHTEPHAYRGGAVGRGRSAGPPRGRRLDRSSAQRRSDVASSGPRHSPHRGGHRQLLNRRPSARRGRDPRHAARPALVEAGWGRERRREDAPGLLAALRARSVRRGGAERQGQLEDAVVLASVVISRHGGQCTPPLPPSVGAPGAPRPAAAPGCPGPSGLELGASPRVRADWWCWS